MKEIKAGTAISCLSVLFYVVYNTIYGWNLEPIDNTEMICDKIATCGVILGIVISLQPLRKLYREAVKNYERK